MKPTRWYTGLVALGAAGALVLSGCSGSAGSEKKTQGSSGSVDSNAVIVTNGSNPARPLIPTDTGETGGGQILTLMFSGLVYYDVDGNIHNDLAESIESDDSKNFTVKIRKDAKFHDGTPVKAQNFVNAWNFGAGKDNAQYNAYFFEDIQGYTDSEHVDELSGLKVVDDHTFTIELKQPAADFPQRLGYTAYVPLPDVAFKDIAAFGKKPIGNGPYELEKFTEQSEAVLVKSDTYNGPLKPKNGGVTLKFYAQDDAAYSDLQSGALDVLTSIPASALKTYLDDFPNRSIFQPSAVSASFTVPERLPHFGGQEGKLRRQALSMAIDRQAIIDNILDGKSKPAADFTSPVIPGFNENLPGSEVLKFNPEEAKKRWAEADKISPWKGTFKIAYNADASHQSWVDAALNQIKNTLGIDVAGEPIPLFSELREQVTNRSITTAFRTGWQADYPGMYNFLGPLYATNAGSNDGDYSSPMFDQLIKEANSTSDKKVQAEKYAAAQKILFEDLPAIPLWYGNARGAWSEAVDNVQFGWDSAPLFYNITKKQQ